MTEDIYLIIGIFTFLFMGVTMYTLGIGAERIESKYIIAKSRAKNINGYLFFSILFFSLMCGLRYRTGADCEAYVKDYLRYKDYLYIRQYEGSVDEYLYTLILKVLAAIGAGRILFLGLLAFLEIFFFYNALRTRNYLFPYIGLVLILGPHFLMWNNGIRQFIAASIFVFALVGLIDIEKKNSWRFFLWIFIAFLFHKSAIILIPLYFVLWYNRKPHKLLSLSIFLSCLYIGISGLSFLDFGKFENLLVATGYDNYAEKIDIYSGLDSSIKNFGPRRLSLILTYIIIILFGEKMDVFYKSEKFYRITYLFFMIYSCGTEALLSKTNLFVRPFLYFTPFYLIITAYLLYYLKSTKKTFLFWFAIITTCTYSILNAIAEASIPGEFAVYKFIFFHP